jgi:hypothetical protein
VKRFLKQVRQAPGVDLEAWEFGLRAAVLAAGAGLLERLLAGIGSGRREEPLVCACGAVMVSKGRRSKEIQTILGTVRLRRSLYVCERCGASRVPGDEELAVAGTKFSPGMRRLMSRVGQRDTFKEGRDDLEELAAIRVTAKEVERVAERTGAEIEMWQQAQQPQPPADPIPILYISYDGTGIPMVPWETAGRKGKQADGGSRTREAKLGCVFTQTKVDDDGFPVRDDDSTTFVGAIESSETFGERIYAEAKRRGLAAAKKVVIIADGARYNWEIASLHFPEAIQIVDLYHARQHLYSLCELLFPGQDQELRQQEINWLTQLDEGKVEEIISAAQRQLPGKPAAREAAEKEIGYFQNNAGRMRYRKYRQQGLFVGSGVVEAGCKTVIGKRLKQSGMEWTVRGANAILALRCCHRSGRIEDFWEQAAA